MKVGVAVANQYFDLNVPYSEAVFINAPVRVCYCDETRMELDCKGSSKGMSDCIFKEGGTDDGTSLIPKNSRSACAVCGRLGDNRMMLVYIVYSSGGGALSSPHGLRTLYPMTYLTRKENDFRGIVQATLRSPRMQTFASFASMRWLSQAMGYGAI